MKNNSTHQTLFSTNEANEFIHLEQRIARSLRKNNSHNAKEATLKALLWYASSLEIKRSSGGIQMELAYN